MIFPPSRIMKYFASVKSYFLFSILFLQACSWFQEESKEDFHLEMVTLPTLEQTGILGDSILTHFQYSLQMSEHEITQREFKEAMGFDPIPNDNSQLVNGDAPATYVTYYDAIRFCNAASHKMGLDSVYFYSSVMIGQDGHANSMEGLSVDFSKDGFRLPTEAEWEFAAGNGSKATLFPWGNDTSVHYSNAWSNLNSSAILHPVCDKKKSEWGLCDLAGNALEWTEDYLVNLPNLDSVTNYIGPAQAPADFQKVVKGGSFTSALPNLKRTIRKDVYAVYPETRLSYLGFRVVRGAISSPQASNGDQLSQGNGSPIHLLATRDQVRAFFGSAEVRLTMVNGSSNNLVSIDYLESNVRAREWQMNDVVRHPVISPNGRMLAWGNVSEGQKKSGTIWLAPFANPTKNRTVTSPGVIPRFWVDESNQDTLLHFASHANPNSDSLEWIQGNTLYYRLCGDSTCLSRPGIWIPEGSYHGGTSADGEWTITAYQELRAHNRSSESTKTLFLPPLNGKDAKGSTQACNASIGGAEQQILFLDFGSTSTSTLVGRPYGIHEYLFLMDPATGKVEDTILVPEPWKAWNQSEWSTNTKFAIATVTDASEQNKAVYAIRFPDHAVLKIAEGEDILTPHLWVYDGKSPSLAFPDSLFAYDTPKDDANYFYSFLLLQLWDFRNDLQTLAIGSSRVFHGINDSILKETGFATNFSPPGLEVWGMGKILENYLSLHTQLETVIMELSLEFLQRDSTQFMPHFLTNSNGYQYDFIHDFWKNGISSSADSLIDRRIQERKWNDTTLKDYGFYPMISTGWHQNDLDKKTIPTPYASFWKESLRYFTSLAKKQIALGRRVVIFLPPQSPGYRKSNLYGRYGISLTLAQEMMDSLAIQTKGIRGLTILDEHKMGLHDYTEAMAHDWDHLSEEGSKQLTRRVVQVLDTLQKP